MNFPVHRHGPPLDVRELRGFYRCVLCGGKVAEVFGYRDPELARTICGFRCCGFERRAVVSDVAAEEGRSLRERVFSQLGPPEAFVGYELHHLETELHAARAASARTGWAAG